MNSFFNKYTQEGSAAVSRIAPIPRTNDFLGFGSKDSDGLLIRFDQNGQVIWERTYAAEKGETCYFIQGWPTNEEGFMVLGSVNTANANRRYHLLVRIDLSGNVLFSRVIFSGSTRNSVRLIPHESGEFTISGWENFGYDRIGVYRTDQSGNINFSCISHLGADDQFYDAAPYQGGLLFVGGTNKSSRWDGFLIKTDYNHQQRSAFTIGVPDTNAVDELDAILPTQKENFYVAGHNQNDIFICSGNFKSDELYFGSLCFANLQMEAKARKIIYKNGFVYVLGYNTKDLRQFVIKFNPSAKHPNQTRIWVKTFDADPTYYLTDFLATEAGFLLCGFFRDPKNVNTPLLIKTDDELNTCLTKEIPIQPLDAPVQKFIVQRVDSLVENVKFANNQIRLSTVERRIAIEELCPVPPELGTCPLAFTAWNALESRARTRNIDRALKAEIRDPMWMLSRQWQWGEFNGEDGGSIVYSKLSMRTTKMNRYTQLVSNPVNKPYNNDIPLECLVERVNVDIAQDWMLRLEAGDYWLKLCRKKFSADQSAFDNYKQGFVGAYAFELPKGPDPLDFADPLVYQSKQIEYAQLTTREDTWLVLNAAHGRVIDGQKLLSALQAGSVFNHSFINSADNTLLLEIRNEFLTWYLKHYSDPMASDPAWSKNYLEHQFQCSAPHPADPFQKIKLNGREYSGEQLDWYNVDVVIDPTTGVDDTSQTFNEAVTKNEVNVLIPSRLAFPGMPSPRWWQMEDHQVDYGNMLINTTDISKLLLLDFMINCAENWYIIPHAAEVGSLIELEGIEVKDNFGIRTLIRSGNQVDSSGGSSYRKWGVFQLERESGNQPPGSLLFLAPAVPNILESKPVEKISFIRDETANLVWGIEQTISSGLTGGVDGHEASVALRNYLQPPSDDVPVSNNPDPDQPVALKYKLATSVPENWIPFIPVHTTDSNRSIQLQRAKMQRTIPDFSNDILPRTNLLKAPLSPYFIHEEEVPKAGRVITATWQRARWFGGKVLVWYGHKKEVGRGGGTSGLKFDQLA